MRSWKVALTLALGLFPYVSECAAQASDELAWSIGYEPRSLDPAKVDDQGSETIRYLTAGVLLRFNRATQQTEPGLAAAWALSPDGRSIKLTLRPGLRFSDGRALSAKDAAWSIRRVLAAATAAPVAEEFLEASAVKVEQKDERTIVVTAPRRIVNFERLFDEIAIEPADHPSEAGVTSGPFFVSERRPGQYVRLKRNPYFWEHDSYGRQLPYLAGLRLEFVGNPEQELRYFQRGDYQFMTKLSPDHFNYLKQHMGSAPRDLGPSLNTEQLWFNQASASSLPLWEKSWFTSRAFRSAVSRAIHREDLARVAYLGHATPAYSYVSPANTAWYNRGLNPSKTDVAAALSTLASAGFRRVGKILEDGQGHPVRFSILTNAGNPARMKMATLIQQDLGALGMQVTIAALDFPALIERLMHTQDYEACLLGLDNVDPDPNAMMNVWLSSSPNHQWNPSEKTPATPWEAEIDRQMNLQATSSKIAERKAAVDRVQQIVADQLPFIYLVYPNTLIAVSPRVRGVQPIVFDPNVIWNIEKLELDAKK